MIVIASIILYFLRVFNLCEVLKNKELKPLSIKPLSYYLIKTRRVSTFRV